MAAGSEARRIALASVWSHGWRILAGAYTSWKTRNGSGGAPSGEKSPPDLRPSRPRKTRPLADANS
jgi:hypothetical protein